MSDVRVRLAPSPTGPMHVGTAYIALFNRAFAQSRGGTVVLRIEDTDQTRSRPEYEERLIDSLTWLGQSWAEGPDVGGPCGPYRQSERLGIYAEQVEKLIAAGHAYRCFCTGDRLDTLRAAQAAAKQRLGYDGHCRDLPTAEVEAALAAGTPSVIRLRVPATGESTLRDSLRGEITFQNELIDDQVLLKSDGFPTYHLAVVVDDHLMQISHVIRGEEWINSTPKHLLLYQNFGWEPPQYTHLPLLLNPDGSKMSKRKNPTAVDYYRRAGYLAPALCNYLALMSYPPLGEEEKFDYEQWRDQFDLNRINLGGSIFDPEKLDWLNGRYLRENLTPPQLLAEMKRWLLNDDYIERMIPLMQPRMETLGDLMPKCWFFLSRIVEPTPEDLVPKKRTPEEVVPVLQTVIWSLDQPGEWNRDNVETAVKGVAAYWDWPIRDITAPLFAAIMAQKVGPPLFESIDLLGIDLTRARIMNAMDLLGSLSKKKMSKLEKAWAKRS